MSVDMLAGRAFWQMPSAELQQWLGANENGLSSAEATARLARYGPNALEPGRRLSLPFKVLGRLRNPLVLVLLAAAFVSALSGELASFVIISMVVLVSVVLDSVQEHRAEKAAELTGESYPTEKHPAADGVESAEVAEAIRTRRNPLRSRPHPLLAMTSLAIVACGILLPYTSLGRWFGLVPPPATYLLALGGMVAAYLLLAEAVKRWFYRHQPPRGVVRAPVLRPHLPMMGPR
jgi:magnesium-transporting ATPase (P-type)